MHLYVATVTCVAQCCAGKRAEIFCVSIGCIDASYVANGCIEVDSAVMESTEVQACCNILCCGTFCMLRWMCCKTSAMHPLMVQFGAPRCTMTEHIPHCNVSHGSDARRVAPVQIAHPRRPRAAPLHPRARRCADGHHRRKHRHDRNGVGDRSGDGDNVRCDCGLGHRCGDEDGRTVRDYADVERKRRRSERRVCDEHAVSACKVPAHACEVPARSLRSVGSPLQRACKVPATRLLRFSETPTRLMLLEGVARRPKQAVLCFAFFSGSLMLLSAISTALVSTVAPRPSSHT